jgi:hypothetical protein
MLKLITTTATAAAVLLAATNEAAADVQSDLVSVCVDNTGKRTPVRYIAGRQTCGNLKLLKVDRQAYGALDFATYADEEASFDECTVIREVPALDGVLCVGFTEGDENIGEELCTVWFDSPDPLTRSNEAIGGQFEHIVASVGEGEIASTEVSFYNGRNYIVEVDVQHLTFSERGDCLAVGRSSAASIATRD